MKAERITDYFVTVIPETVDVNDVEAFAMLREEMQRQVEVMLLRQYERPPKALMLEPTEWLVTDSPDEVEGSGMMIHHRLARRWQKHRDAVWKRRYERFFAWQVRK